MDNELKKFADWMREEREKHSMTQRDLATKAGIGLSTIQGLEAYRANSLSTRIKDKIQNALNNIEIQDDDTSTDKGVLDDFKPYMLRLAALVEHADFEAQINAIMKNHGLSRLLAIVYLFDKELKNI